MLRIRTHILPLCCSCPGNTLRNLAQLSALLAGTIACVCGVPAISFAGTTACSGNQCTYSCDNSSDDVPAINAAIAQVSEAGGGVVNLSPGTCLVNQPISFENMLGALPNVWLKGAGTGSGGTTLRRTVFQLNTNVIQANVVLTAGVSPPTNSNIEISDLTIDAGTLYLAMTSLQAYPSGTTLLTFPNGAFTTMLGTSANGYNLVGVYDFSNPSAIKLPAPGNIQSITPGSNVTEIELTAPTAAPIAAGDTLVFYAGGGGIEIDYVNGVTIENVNMWHGSPVRIEGSSNFVVANSSFANAQDFGTFFCLGGLFVGTNEPYNQYGFVVNNKFTYTTMEMDAFHTVVSGNAVIPTTCGGINGSIGQYDTFQGNTVMDSLNATAYDGFSLPYNHDNLLNPAMQIWNPDALIAENLVYHNGGAGILSGGSNNVVARNVAYDNAQSPSYNQGRGGSGIFLQGPGATITNNSVAANLSCNTKENSPAPANPTAPTCLTQTNSGPQQYGFVVLNSVTGTVQSKDNTFYPGNAGTAEANLSGGSMSTVNSAAQATISATPCTAPSGQACATTISWSSAGITSASIYVSNSTNPSQVTLFASGIQGAQQVTLASSAIYVFRLMDGMGASLASVTVQPTNFVK